MRGGSDTCALDLLCMHACFGHIIVIGQGQYMMMPFWRTSNLLRDSLIRHQMGEHEASALSEAFPAARRTARSCQSACRSSSASCGR